MAGLHTLSLSASSWYFNWENKTFRVCFYLLIYSTTTKSNNIIINHWNFPSMTRTCCNLNGRFQKCSRQPHIFPTSAPNSCCSPTLSCSKEMNGHDRIYIAAPPVVSSAGCTAMLSITSYKFQLSSLSDKITHTSVSTAVVAQSGQAGGREKERKQASKKKSEILPLKLIYSKSTQDKPHSGVIKADLAWFTRYRRDRISVIRAKQILRSIFFDGLKINKTLLLINMGTVGSERRMLMRRSAAAAHRSAPPPHCYWDRRLC